MRHPRWHRRLAHRLGYDIEKFNQQVTLETHLRGLLPRQDINLVLDVGANNGQFASMLRDLGYRGEIVSFEPAGASFGILEAAAASDPAWRVLHLGLSDTDGTAELNIPRVSPFASLHSVNASGRAKFGDQVDTVQVETVELARLDNVLPSIVPDFEARNAFLKMDTQGHDLMVFEGAGAFRSQFDLLESEVSVVPMYDGAPHYLDTLAHYRSFGYEVTGLYTVNRTSDTWHVIEFDCVMTPRAED